VRFFASNNKGDLTTKEMIKKHTQMGNNKWTVPYKVDAIKHMLDDNNLEHNVSSMLKLINPASSGIWDTDGNFNQNVLNALVTKQIMINNQQVITKKIFEDFIKERHSDGIHPKTATTLRIFGCLPFNVTWEKVTQGSVNEIFECFSDVTYHHDGIKEDAITVETLQHFYQHPAESMQALIDKHSQLTEQNDEHTKLTCPYASQS
jgi:hypothetical protein